MVKLDKEVILVQQVPDKEQLLVPLAKHQEPFMPVAELVAVETMAMVLLVELIPETVAAVAVQPVHLLIQEPLVAQVLSSFVTPDNT